MSGHSHFATIKRKKASNDEQKSKTFSKMARELSIAARAGGGDPASNATLRQLIDKARSMNMPANNVERAIRKGSGQEPGISYEEMLIEAYGPGSVSLLISAASDNKNRTLGEIRKILTNRQGKMVEEGGVRWAFEQKGIIAVPSAGAGNETASDALELAAIEAGADDVRTEGEDFVEIHTPPSELERVRSFLAEKGFPVESASLGWVPKETMRIGTQEEEAAMRLLEELNDHDDVREVYANW